MQIIVRPAIESDQQAICNLVRSERLNPTGLKWQNFLVAADEAGICGAVQLRRHADGSRELGSLVVAPPARGQGMAARLIEALLADERGRVLMITDGAFAWHYERWGFKRIDTGAAPSAVRFNYRIGRLTRVISFLLRRPKRKLVILDRVGERYPRAMDDARMKSL